jgi:hypothetical protein
MSLIVNIIFMPREIFCIEFFVVGTQNAREEDI